MPHGKRLMRYRLDLPYWDLVSQSDSADQVALSSSKTLQQSRYFVIACDQ